MSTAPTPADRATQRSRNRTDSRDTGERSGPVPDELAIEAWLDPVIDAHGYDPRSPYVERFWVGVLGPSAIWLHRHVSSLLVADPGGTTIDLRVVAGQLGLRWNGGRHSPMFRTLERCCAFKTARRIDDTTVAFRRRLPPLSAGQLRRLPPEIVAEHARWVEAGGRRDPTVDPTLHAELLANAFADRGATLHETVGWLDTCGVPTDSAIDATVRVWSTRPPAVIRRS